MSWMKPIVGPGIKQLLKAGKVQGKPVATVLSNGKTIRRVRAGKGVLAVDLMMVQTKRKIEGLTNALKKMDFKDAPAQPKKACQGPQVYQPDSKHMSKELEKKLRETHDQIEVPVDLDKVEVPNAPPAKKLPEQKPAAAQDGADAGQAQRKQSRDHAQKLKKEWEDKKRELGEQRENSLRNAEAWEKEAREIRSQNRKLSREQKERAEYLEKVARAAREHAEDVRKMYAHMRKNEADTRQTQAIIEQIKFQQKRWQDYWEKTGGR